MHLSKHLVTRADLSTFSMLEMLPHAKERSISRHIPERWINAVAAYGGWNLSYRVSLTGDEDIFHTSNPSEMIQSDLGLEIDNAELHDLCRLVVVISPDGRRAITVFRTKNVLLR